MKISANSDAINAVTVRSLAGVQDQGKPADAALACGERQPLLGVPMTVKETLQCRGPGFR
jgi:amidase